MLWNGSPFHSVGSLTHIDINTPLIVLFFLQKIYLSLYTYVCMYSHMYIDTYINAYTCIYVISMHNVPSWPAYRFLGSQVRWSGIPISWRIFQFVVIHTVKGFGAVNSGCFSGTPLFFLCSNRCWQLGKLVPNWERGTSRLYIVTLLI